MVSRRSLGLLIAAAFFAMGASYRTTNFIVEGPTPQVAQQIGQAAEKYRKEKAIEWLGQEMPTWPEPCPIKVTVQMGGAGGATTFLFDGAISQSMHLEGPLDRLLASVLPHEITHTVFAYYFRCPVPRWADEGGSVLSEDDLERSRHDALVRQILNSPGKAIPLRRLFCLKKYPRDVMCLYAEGYSVTNFLVANSNRQTFLAFVARGMQRDDWDSAVKAYYGYRNVEELEEAWLQHLKSTKKPPVQLAQNPQTGRSEGDRVVLRQTAPPAQPGFDTYRGQSPEDAMRTRPGYLPESNPRGPSQPASWSNPDRSHLRPGPASPATLMPPERWHPAPPASAPPTVRLGPPQ